MDALPTFVSRQQNHRGFPDPLPVGEPPASHRCTPASRPTTAQILQLARRGSTWGAHR